jgi:hypothetical protein
MPTKDELISSKPAADAADATPAEETKDLAEKCAAASADLKSAAAGIEGVAADTKTSGKELESVAGTLLGLDWLPGLGGGLKSAGTALKSVGAALESNADSITASAEDIAAALTKVAKLLDEADAELTSLSNDLAVAQHVWDDAGADFAAAQEKCEVGFKEIEDKIADVAGEVDDSTVSAWQDLTGLFEDSQAKHVAAAKAVDEKAQAVEANLSSNSAALADAADALTSLVGG